MSGIGTCGEPALKKISFRELIRGCPGQSVVRWLWYQWVRFVCWCWFRLFYRLKIQGRENLPMTGPVLVISNHQSFLDPILIGMATGKRPMSMLARRNLFKPFFMGWLLRSLNGIPVDRGSADLAAMRTCIEVLKKGEGLSLFPEGTRSEDCSNHFSWVGCCDRLMASPLIVAVRIWLRCERALRY